MTISNVHLQGVRRIPCDKSPFSKAQGQENICLKINLPPPIFFSREELSEETSALKMRLLCLCVSAFALWRLGRQI